MNEFLASYRKNLFQQLVLLSVPPKNVTIKYAQLLIQLRFLLVSD